jgi:hypothetical protein
MAGLGLAIHEMPPRLSMNDKGWGWSEPAIESGFRSRAD